MPIEEAGTFRMGSYERVTILPSVQDLSFFRVINLCVKYLAQGVSKEFV